MLGFLASICSMPDVRPLLESYPQWLQQRYAEHRPTGGSIEDQRDTDLEAAADTPSPGDYRTRK